MSDTAPSPAAVLSELAHSITVAHAAELIGTWIAVLLCGLAISQAYHYFHERFEDRVWIKVAAWLITVLNVVHTALVCLISYHYLIQIRSDSLEELTVYWAIDASIGTHLAISAIALFYFIDICYHLVPDQKMKWIACLILGVPVMFHLGFGIDSVVHAAEIDTFLELGSFRESAIIPMLSCQVASDIMISGALCLALPRAAAGRKQTRNVIHRIMIYAVSRGIITSVAALVELVALIVAPNSLWFMAAEYIVAGLYTNSFFSSLNSRKAIRKGLMGRTTTNATPPTPIPLGLYSPQSSGATACDEASTVQGSKGVKVDVYTIQEYDDLPVDQV
ncbi:hypothetical protein BC629DRAFT_190616 [Irpex lacteus]|nr:hypothetical protein BC629DRAFT_190616 [Irpex lacteus]